MYGRLACVVDRSFGCTELLEVAKKNGRMKDPTFRHSLSSSSIVPALLSIFAVTLSRIPVSGFAAYYSYHLTSFPSCPYF